MFQSLCDHPSMKWNYISSERDASKDHPAQVGMSNSSFIHIAITVQPHLIHLLQVVINPELWC